MNGRRTALLATITPKHEAPSKDISDLPFLFTAIFLSLFFFIFLVVLDELYLKLYIDRQAVRNMRSLYQGRLVYVQVNMLTIEPNRKRTGQANNSNK